MALKDDVTPGIESLRLLEVKIPQHAVRDQDAHLECKYELRGESLYAVKWYKDGHEFFRYIPKDNPPTQIFELPGVRVNVSFLEPLCWCSRLLLGSDPRKKLQFVSVGFPKNKSE
ncbi:hypothetical protein RUM43_009929 [Polyplax serrata]|uniref:Ig-like domain-containing protein n=1 Tax=Polyplax serrata TaxID=468196 RepID=A0AAN8PKN6_POLSC